MRFEITFTLEGNTMNQNSPDRRSIFRFTSRIALGVLIALVAGAFSAAEAQPDDYLQPSEALQPSSAGNVTQGATFAYHEGMRLLEQAKKAAIKAEEADTDKKRQKLEKKVISSYEQATQQFISALRQDADLFEAYEPLGRTFRTLGKYQEALEIHAIALRRNEESMENFTGWAESLMELNMLGNATQAYAAYVEADSPRAPILMDAMKKWLVAKQADPGDLDPANVQRLADWIEQQGAGS
jgi:tetratricopeptide (TPR) repeat protein